MAIIQFTIKKIHLVVSLMHAYTYIMHKISTYSGSVRDELWPPCLMLISPAEFSFHISINTCSHIPACALFSLLKSSIVLCKTIHQGGKKLLSFIFAVFSIHNETKQSKHISSKKVIKVMRFLHTALKRRGKA